MLTLSVIQGPDQGKKFELPAGAPQLIGRSSEALPITDTTVSRRHAELTPDGQAWFIRDLQSQNGTYVNGVPIRGRVRLNPGDQIRVGSSVFVFGRGEKEDASVVRLARPDELDSEIEHRMISNEDSIVLAEPEPTRAAVDHLRVIYRLTTLTSLLTNRRDLLRAVMDLVFEEFKPERGVIMLTESDAPSAELRPYVVRYKQPPRDEEERQIQVSRSIIKAAVEQGEGVLSSNAQADARFASGDSVSRFNIRSAICSPIRFQDRTFGAIYIDSSIANYTFVQSQLALMNAIGQHTGLALANAEKAVQQLHTEKLAAVGETVASLSHSIKNILQGLRGGADLVEMGLRKQDLKIASGGWNILKRNLDRIVGLTQNMLAFSRQRQVEIELTKIGPIVNEAAQLMEGPFADKQVALLVDVDPDMPPVPCDASLLHQALMNLLGNALDACEPRRGAVTVRVSYHQPRGARPAPAPFALIRVIDNGSGIPRDRLQWIFEPFKSTKGLRGTGLGLAVTKRIVQEHRGRITVESEVGKGSTFSIYLPADHDNLIDPSATTNEKGFRPDLIGGV